MPGKRILSTTVMACLLAILAMPAAAGTIIDFSVTDPDLRLPGDADQDRSGQFVLLGDVDGDNRDDIIIAAPNGDFSGRSNCGTVHIFLTTGTAPTGTVDLGTAVPNLRRIHGATAGDAIGNVMACGDVNNDNRDDILIGVPGALVNGKFQAGKVIVILGSANPAADLDLAVANSLVVEILGADTFHKLGTSIAVGNVNDDGFGDIIMGAPFATAPAGAFAGKIYVVPGASSFAATIDLATPPAGVIQVNGANTNDTFGTACYAADVNDDNVDDIIGGSPQATPLGRSSAGISYIVPGSSTIATTIDVSDGAAAGIVQIFGSTANSLAGSRFCAADLNGDAVSDVIVAAPEMDALGRASAGAVYVIAGSAAWQDTIDLASGGLTRIDGPAANVKLGLTLQAGDLNLDGYDDLVMGIPLMTPFVGRDEAGIVYAVFGRLNFAANVDLAATQTGLTKIYGANKNDHAGRSVAVGDIDNDSYSDILLGAENVRKGTDVEVGESYVVYGTPAITPTQLVFQRASAALDGVDLEWIVAEDMSPLAFHIDRDGPHGRSDLASDRVVRSSPAHYSIRDTGIEPGETYRYTVTVVDEDTQVLFTTTVRVPDASPALELRAHPNPTRGAASVAFNIPRDGRATVAVYDVTGARVATLADDVFGSGINTTAWDGRTHTGERAASGVYFVRLQFEGRQQLRKLLVVR